MMIPFSGSWDDLSPKELQFGASVTLHVRTAHWLTSLDVCGTQQQKRLSAQKDSFTRAMRFLLKTSSNSYLRESESAEAQ